MHRSLPLIILYDFGSPCLTLFFTFPLSVSFSRCFSRSDHLALHMKRHLWAVGICCVLTSFLVDLALQEMGGVCSSQSMPFCTISCASMSPGIKADWLVVETKKGRDKIMYEESKRGGWFIKKWKSFKKKKKSERMNGVLYGAWCFGTTPGLYTGTLKQILKKACLKWADECPMCKEVWEGGTSVSLWAEWCWGTSSVFVSTWYARTVSEAVRLRTPAWRPRALGLQGAWRPGFHPLPPSKSGGGLSPEWKWLFWCSVQLLSVQCVR